MAKERFSMRKFKEVLRLKFETDLSNRQIAKSCSTSHVTVGKYLALAEKAELSWPLPENLDDAEIEKLLVEHTPRRLSQKPGMPPMQYLHQELQRKHVTLQLLWYGSVPAFFRNPAINLSSSHNSGSSARHGSGYG